MAKPQSRTLSRPTQAALTHLGHLVRAARIARKETVAQLAERAGVSRGLMQRIEHGDPGCAIGAVFEAASLVGIRLFDLEPAQMSMSVARSARELTLLPRAARAPRREVKDDF